MAPVKRHEPQSAADYDDRTTAAVKAVLLEIGQILASFRGKFASTPQSITVAALQRGTRDQAPGGL